MPPETVALATRVPKALQKAVRLAALAGEVTMAEWVTGALVDELARRRGTTGDEKPARARGGGAPTRARVTP